MARHHNLTRVIVIGSLTDLALGGRFGHRASGFKIQTEQGGHGPDPNGHGGLHCAAARTQQTRCIANAKGPRYGQR